MKEKETSYPRNKIKILLLENISDSAVQGFLSGGYESIERRSTALSEDELMRAVKDVHILGIRSKTRITRDVLAAAEKLLAVGCFCIGVNQVDLKAAAAHGIAVFNAPYSNTRSVAELVIGLCVMLIRKVVDKSAAAHRGVWLKDAKSSYELRGKTLGIIGYGNIGSQVSVMAEALGMNVIYYDIVPRLPHGNARQVAELSSLLERSHIVTLHVPSDARTRYMINEETLQFIRRGAIFINYSRGDVVD
ncbi:MAG: phosphoglycerate dehydrogenase, partial [Acidobacteria bacterium]|nr:phosphoglycerate dehydrogenase [Acidobacteriota bacterium]